MAERLSPNPQPEHDPHYDSPGIPPDAEVPVDHPSMIAADEQPSGHDVEHPSS